MRFVSQLALAAMFTAALSLINPAMAGCRRMGFTVNDYGLEGPKRDAQNLLDKHIAEWASEQGIEKFNVGKKDVSCELYLNLIVFDEHTCTATATVCWGDSINRAQPQSASTKSKSTPAKKEATAKSSETKQPAAEEKKAAEAAPSDDEAAESATTAQSDADSKSEAERETAATASKSDDDKQTADAAEAEGDQSDVETGTIPVPNTAAGTAAAVSPLTVDTSVNESATAGYSSTGSLTTTADDTSAGANSAAAAAEAAAAAAERAASAAERAAKAAERAAAALAASSTSATEAPAATKDTPSSTSTSTSTSSSTSAPVAPVRQTP